jgi:hypothetical protein
MNYLFSRFGGHMMRIGHGKASKERLPEDQSLDNLLDHFSEEVYPNCFVLSSYDMLPSFMGAREKLSDFAVRLGTLHHVFNDMMLQNYVVIKTDIYITTHEYNNVFALHLHTAGDGMQDVMDDYIPTFDYVQTTFFRDAHSDERCSLSDHPNLLALMLYVLFYKMEIYHTKFIFEPSSSDPGNCLEPSFISSLATFYEDINDSDELQQKLLKTFPSLFENNAVI